MKGMLLTLLAVGLILTMAGCGSGSGKAEEAKKVVIYTNADEEAVTSIETALKNAGYDGKYVLQTFGTSELGGKLMAEGDKIEADLITMSSYFIESSQSQHPMYKDLSFKSGALEQYPAYYTPILANTGSIFVNTEVLKEKGLPMPTSIKDLTAPEFKGLVSIPNIMDSSTAWLLVKQLLANMGKTRARRFCMI